MTRGIAQNSRLCCPHGSKHCGGNFPRYISAADTYFLNKHALTGREHCGGNSGAPAALPAALAELSLKGRNFVPAIY